MPLAIATMPCRSAGGGAQVADGSTPPRPLAAMVSVYEAVPMATSATFKYTVLELPVTVR